LLVEGIYCWLCENGSVDDARWSELLNAINILYGGITEWDYWYLWIEHMSLCRLRQVREAHALYFLTTNCAPCTAFNCTDWQGAFLAWEYQVNLNTNNGGYFPADSGITKSKWVVDHGIQPFQSPAGSGNFSCMEVSVFTGEVFLNRLEIGLESAYGAPGTLTVVGRLAGTSTEVLINSQSYLASADYFNIEIDNTVGYDKIIIHFERTDANCVEILDPVPTIRYNIWQGIGTNPFPL